MSRADESVTELERNARIVLEESVRRIDARTRSRLNQARHAALAAGGRRRAWWSSFTLMPAAGAIAAALLVAVVLWHREPAGTQPLALDGQHPAVEDMELLTDNDSIDLIEGWDGSFYEWAAAQSDAGAESNS
jgi:cytochrome c-type biogenesis protein CcmH/NrfG